jgi:hypothetical protein
VIEWWCWRQSFRDDAAKATSRPFPKRDFLWSQRSDYGGGEQCSPKSRLGPPKSLAFGARRSQRREAMHRETPRSPSATAAGSIPADRVVNENATR